MSKETLCGLLGVSRQAHHHDTVRDFRERSEAEIVLAYVRDKRVGQPKVGVRKLQIHLQDLFAHSGIKMGRDALFDLLRENGLLVRRRAKKPKTTDSHHYYRRYPNHIRGFIASGPHQLWVCDLTYVETKEGFVYLFLITDAYSRKIVGFSTAETMEAMWAIEALKQATGQLPADHQLIHHSDRGSQYACPAYTNMLEGGHDIKISMSERGDPLENCMAERTNGLVKELFPSKFETKLQAILQMPPIIHIYNCERLHGSIDMMTPQQAHQKQGPLFNRWKKQPAVASI